MAGVKTGFIVDKDGTQGAIFKDVLNLGSGFSINSAFTADKLGLGIEKMVSDKLGIGGYGMERYNDLLGGRVAITPAFGISLKF